MNSITLDNISKRYGHVQAVADVCMEVGEGERFFLLGPSGCGKTTMLRLIAGFAMPDQGSIKIHARDVTGLRPQKRHAAMVFQHYALWPHMTVAENIAYGLKIRKVNRTGRQARVRQALDMVRMWHLADRKPGTLSGGQQQRVALARALVVEPLVLLMDEPLSNLDPSLREEMRDEILRLQAATGVTMVYVTHDQQEALSMADRIAVMQDGRIRQQDTPQRIYQFPGSRFVASFVGDVTVIPVIRRLAEDRYRTEAGEFQAAMQVEAADKLLLGIRPEDIHVALPGRRDTANHFHATVEKVRYEGSRIFVIALCNGHAFGMTLPGRQYGTIRPGERLHLHVPPEGVLVFTDT